MLPPCLLLVGLGCIGDRFVTPPSKARSKGVFSPLSPASFRASALLLLLVIRSRPTASSQLASQLASQPAIIMMDADGAVALWSDAIHTVLLQEGQRAAQHANKKKEEEEEPQHHHHRHPRPRHPQERRWSFNERGVVLAGQSTTTTTNATNSRHGGVGADRGIMHQTTKATRTKKHPQLLSSSCRSLNLISKYLETEQPQQQHEVAFAELPLLVRRKAQENKNEGGDDEAVHDEGAVDGKDSEGSLATEPSAPGTVPCTPSQSFSSVEEEGPSAFLRRSLPSYGSYGDDGNDSSRRGGVGEGPARTTSTGSSTPPRLALESRSASSLASLESSSSLKSPASSLSSASSSKSKSSSSSTASSCGSREEAGAGNDDNDKSSSLAESQSSGESGRAATTFPLEEADGGSDGGGGDGAGLAQATTTTTTTQREIEVTPMDLLRHRRPSGEDAPEQSPDVGKQDHPRPASSALSLSSSGSKDSAVSDDDDEDIMDDDDDELVSPVGETGFGFLTRPRLSPSRVQKEIELLPLLVAPSVASPVKHKNDDDAGATNAVDPHEIQVPPFAAAEDVEEVPSHHPKDHRIDGTKALIAAAAHKLLELSKVPRRPSETHHRLSVKSAGSRLSHNSHSNLVVRESSAGPGTSQRLGSTPLMPRHSRASGTGGTVVSNDARSVDSQSTISDLSDDVLTYVDMEQALANAKEVFGYSGEPSPSKGVAEKVQHFQAPAQMTHPPFTPLTATASTPEPKPVRPADELTNEIPVPALYEPATPLFGHASLPTLREDSERNIEIHLDIFVAPLFPADSGPEKGKAKPAEATAPVRVPLPPRRLSRRNLWSSFTFRSKGASLNRTRLQEIPVHNAFSNKTSDDIDCGASVASQESEVSELAVHLQHEYETASVVENERDAVPARKSKPDESLYSFLRSKRQRRAQRRMTHVATAEAVTERTEAQQVCCDNLRMRWLEKYPSAPLSDDMVLRFALSAPRGKYHESSAWRRMKRFDRRYLTLTASGMEKQLLTKVSPSRLYKRG